MTKCSTIRTAEDIAAAVVDEWDRNYRYPLAWERRAKALEHLIAVAVASAALRVSGTPAQPSKEIIA